MPGRRPPQGRDSARGRRWDGGQSPGRQGARRRGPPRLAIPLPRSTAALIEGVNPGEQHPGLQLDKYPRQLLNPEENPKNAEGWQLSAIGRVCAAKGPEALFPDLAGRRKRLLESVGGLFAQGVTTGPLTLHLSRATALENVGICLHPIYGFPFLPGTGLKGMTQAWAETVWLQSQRDRAQGWSRIGRVFGVADTPLWKERQRRGARHAPPAAGDIVFHDAWPARWPKLEPDILNNHHRRYYDGTGNQNAPGDWEEPLPVTFLRVASGSNFSFALTPRRPEIPDTLLELAASWLTGALGHLGAGAKTNAGYGTIRVPFWTHVTRKKAARRATESVADATNSAADTAHAAGADAPRSKAPHARRQGPETPDQPETPRTFRLPRGSSRALLKAANHPTHETTLTLVAPAFLAGPRQGQKDCELRPATLRGLLRWWWRTLHAGFLEIRELRRLEGVLWGDTSQSGAIRLTLEAREGNPKPEPFDARKILRTIGYRQQGRGIPGLSYHAYGMGERNRQRFFLPPDAWWNICLQARCCRLPKTFGDRRKIESQQVLEQATTALWLLCARGGVGGKSRKGFGSLEEGEPRRINRPSAMENSRRFRETLALPNRYTENLVHSPSLRSSPDFPTIAVNWTNPWRLLHEIGAATQTIVKEQDKPDRYIFGIPRKLRDTAIPDFSRYASPFHWHVGRRGGNTAYEVTLTPFPTPHLPRKNTGFHGNYQLLDHAGGEMLGELRERSP